jgi:hypothetical protein
MAGSGAVLAVVAALAAAGGDAAAAVELAPHRATYRLSMGAGVAEGRFVGVDGLMTIALEKTCDGWLLNQSLAMRLAARDGAEIRQGLRFTGWEALDGTRYRFIARTQTNGRAVDSRGEARAGGAGRAGEAQFTSPDAKTVALPEDALFPVAHTAWLIEQALAGRRQAPRAVFDGTGGEGPQEASAFIGARLEPGQHKKGDRGPLTERPGWRMRIAYFQLEGRTQTPEYEVEVLQLDNGVAPWLVLDFRDFRVALDLDKIEVAPLPAC